MTALFGRVGWLRRFSQAVTGRRDLVDDFLKLFPDIDGVPDSGVSKDARSALHRYAAGKLAEKLRDAEEAWEAERAELVDRRALINEAAEALHENVEDEAREKRNLAREAVAVARQLQEFAQAGHRRSWSSGDCSRTTASWRTAYGSRPR